MNIKQCTLLLLLTFILNNVSAQKIAPTSNDEYLYGAVGYKLQLNAKLDVKQGYHLMDYNPIEEQERKVEFKGIVRNGETKPCAIIMVYTKLRNTPQYYCIPTHDAAPELWQKFYNSLLDESENQQPQLQFYTYCLGNLAAQLSAK